MTFTLGGNARDVVDRVVIETVKLAAMRASTIGMPMFPVAPMTMTFLMAVDGIVVDV